MRYDDGVSRIGSDPFGTPADARLPARRLRGRLASPVTVWTAYRAGGSPAGLTVSSILVAEGDPPEVLGLLDPLSDLWEALSDTGRCVVHVLAADQERAAERFALRFPGDPFESSAVEASAWGPVLSQVPTRASCALIGSTDAGYGRLVRAGIDAVTLDERAAPPLVYFRGTYLRAGPTPG